MPDANGTANSARILAEHSVRASPFCTTHWTVVLAAAKPGEAGAETAFGRLYCDYWQPLYSFVRRRGYSPHDAEDITQAFFTRLIEKHALGGLKREGGRFRSFLLRSMENCLANEWDRSHAQKRGGGAEVLSLDAEAAEAGLELMDAGSASPEAVFERQWVFTLLGLVLQRLRAECAATGKADFFEDLCPHLPGDQQGCSYAEIGARRGMSEGAVKVAAYRLRQRYGEVLREEIARTVSSVEDVDEELRHLMKVVAG